MLVPIIVRMKKRPMMEQLKRQDVKKILLELLVLRKSTDLQNPNFHVSEEIL